MSMTNSEPLSQVLKSKHKLNNLIQPKLNKKVVSFIESNVDEFLSSPLNLKK